MTAAPVAVFVAADGNRFMRDIASWIVEAATASGRAARLVDDRLPRDDGSTNLVVAPHEFYLLRDDPDAAIRDAARHSVPICTEQPGTPWFLMSLGFCVGSRLVVDINPAGVAAIERAGFTARHLQLGGVASIDHSRHRSGPDAATGDGVERDVDVLFLGGFTERRAAALATLGPVLWDRRSELRLVSFSRPLQGDEPGVVFGDAKYDLLARSKVLVNLHRDDARSAVGVGADSGYFEWARLVEAMANRCAVVTEPAHGSGYLRPGEHFVESTVETLADTVVALLDDDARRGALTAAAHGAVMEQHPLHREVGALLRDVEARAWSPPTRGLTRRHPIVREHRPPLLGEFRPHRALRRRIYDQWLAEIDHRREIGRLRCTVEHGTADHVAELATPAYFRARPAVSVVVTLYDYADVVRDTLASIVDSRDVDFEIVVVDDRSTDAGRAVVSDFVDAHPQVPMLLLASDVNRGLPAARNLAIGRARADLVMVMDADNLLYPTCLARLRAALDASPGASFAYATLEAFGTDPGLRSARGWHVPWLCEANYIDAQAMLRRDAWVRHGGYRIDDAIHGWEDWDLWLRMAVAGDHGVHVAEMLGRYRTQASSMISITNLVAAELRAGLVARYPTLPWPEHDRPEHDRPEHDRPGAASAAGGTRP